MVDLVGDEDESRRVGELDELAQFLRRRHRAGRVRGAGDQDALQGRLPMRAFQSLRGQDVIRLRSDRDLDRLDP